MHLVKNLKIRAVLLAAVLVGFLIAASFVHFTHHTPKISPQDVEQNTAQLQQYQGRIYNIFFHSLIVYPQLAYNGNVNTELYQTYMITRDQFTKILEALYKNNFVLVDIDSLYLINKDGTLSQKKLFLPVGKKPLIISLDDLSYYQSMIGHGFADKLVLDKSGNVATEVVTTNGTVEVTRDGDVVPILDDFVKAHPDFSMRGTKGIIALTGFEGILGYRTQATSSLQYREEVQGAKSVVARLKATGWKFASHSYSHNPSFSTGETSLDFLRTDVERWNTEVRPLVGDTNIFIGPFGQIFKPNDPRRGYLIEHGFNILYGVGIDLYTHFYPAYLEMDRVDIDGFRLKNNPDFLKIFFDVQTL